jgi:hypothetical protein
MGRGSSRWIKGGCLLSSSSTNWVHLRQTYRRRRERGRPPLVVAFKVEGSRPETGDGFSGGGLEDVEEECER